MAVYRDKSNETKVTVTAQYKVDHPPDDRGIRMTDHKTLVKVFDSGQPIEYVIQWLRCEVPLEKGAELVDIQIVLESEAL